MSTQERDGLRHKYDVRKADTGEVVTNCFVLRPDADPAARVALLAYARATDSDALASDLSRWVDAIHDALEPAEVARLRRSIGERMVADAALDAERARRTMTEADAALGWARQNLNALTEANATSRQQ